MNISQESAHFGALAHSIASLPHCPIASFSWPLYNQVFKSGPVAQLGARLDGIQEVTGSIPVRSTNTPKSFSLNGSRH